MRSLFIRASRGMDICCRNMFHQPRGFYELPLIVERLRAQCCPPHLVRQSYERRIVSMSSRHDCKDTNTICICSIIGHSRPWSWWRTNVATPIHLLAQNQDKPFVRNHEACVTSTKMYFFIDIYLKQTGSMAQIWVGKEI